MFMDNDKSSVIGRGLVMIGDVWRKLPLQCEKLNIPFKLLNAYDGRR